MSNTITPTGACGSKLAGDFSTAALYPKLGPLFHCIGSRDFEPNQDVSTITL
jgi:hypothetical protein